MGNLLSEIKNRVTIQEIEHNNNIPQAAYLAVVVRMEKFAPNVLHTQSLPDNIEKT